MFTMFGVQDFVVFLIAGITLNLMPGPDTMYIIGRSIAQGRQAGVFSAGRGTGRGTSGDGKGDVRK